MPFSTWTRAWLLALLTATAISVVMLSLSSIGGSGSRGWLASLTQSSERCRPTGLPPVVTTWLLSRKLTSMKLANMLDDFGVLEPGDILHLLPAETAEIKYASMHSCEGARLMHTHLLDSKTYASMRSLNYAIHTLII